MKLSTLSALCLLLAACETEIVYLTPEVPDQIRQCLDAPDMSGAKTQKDVAVGLLDYAAAHQDCKTKLGAVDRSLSLLEAQAEISHK